MPTVTSFQQLLQPSWCQTYRSALLWTTLVRPRGWSCRLGTLGSLFTSPRLAPWRGHFSAAAHSFRNNMGGSSPESWVISVSSDAAGCLRRLEGPSQFYWSATAFFKLGNPQPVRCSPAIVCLLQWVLGAQGIDRKADCKPRTRQRQKKEKTKNLVTSKLECQNIMSRPLRWSTTDWRRQENGNHEPWTQEAQHWHCCSAGDKTPIQR